LALSFIALGSNVAGRFCVAGRRGRGGDPGTANRLKITLISRSRLYRSAAWPDPHEPEFINAMMSVETSLAPDAMLARLHAVEAEFGRVRRQVNAPRTLDLDIVDFAGRVSALGDSPVLPPPSHGRPRLRPSAIGRKSEPDWRHPVTGTAIAKLIQALPDPQAATPL